MTHRTIALAQTFAGLDGWTLPFAVRLLCSLTAVWLVAGMAGLSMRRRGSAAVRHGVWSLSTLAALALPGVLLLTPEWRVGAIRVDAGEGRQLAREAAAAERMSGAAAARGASESSDDVPSLSGARADPYPDSPREQDTVVAPLPPVRIAAGRPAAAVRTAETTDAKARATELTAGGPAGRSGLAWLLPVVWLAGAAWLLARHAVAVLSVRRMLRRGSVVIGESATDSLRRLASGLRVRAEPRLLESGEIGSPVCLGWLRSCIVLPSGWRQWPAEQLDAVLTHELAHVARRDVLWQLLARIATAAYWPHPLAWVAAWRMRVERELACDDWVLRGGQSSTRYARWLLDVATDLRGRVRQAGAAHAHARRDTYPARAAEAVGVAMAARGGFERRIAAILDPCRRRRPVSRRAAVLLGVVALAVLAAVGTLSPLAPTRAAAEPPKTQPATQPAPAAPATAPSTRPDTSTRTTRMAGRVEDGSGRPVAGVRVHVVSSGPRTYSAQTGPDGRFTFDVEGRPFGFFHATTADGARQGVHPVDDAKAEPLDDVRLALKPARELSTTVNDDQGRPVAGAWVTAVARHSMKMAEGRTDAGGKLMLRVPPDAPLDYILAMKPDTGMDYLLFRPKDEPKTDPYKLDPDDAGPFTLVLNGTTTVTVRVADDQKRPLAGVRVYPWYFQKPRRGANVYLSVLQEFHQTTDARGEAVFHNVPADDTMPVNFWARLEGYSAPARCTWDPKARRNEIEATLVKQVPVTGRVLDADGRPAGGALVRVGGAGFQSDSFGGETTSADDGSFGINVDADQYYLFVAGREHQASAGRGQIVQKEPPAPIELKLQPATRVYGVATVRPESAPIAGAFVTLLQRDAESYYKLAPEEQFPGGTSGRNSIQPAVSQHVRTDGRGAFEFFAGPGAYNLFLYSPGANLNAQFKLGDGEKEHETNLHAAELQTGPKLISGRVVRVDKPGEPVAEATLLGEQDGQDSLNVRGTSDRQGRFTVHRGDSEFYLFARTGDDRLKGLILVKPGEDDVTLPVGPAASVRGRLLEADGAPLDGRVVQYGLHIGPPNGPYTISFGGNVTTDADGGFTAGGLVPGFDYELQMVTKFNEEGRAAGWRGVNRVKADRAERIELGDVKLEPLPRPKTSQDYAAEAFDRADPFDQRLDAARRVARLSFQNVLVLLGGPERPAGRRFFEFRHDMSHPQIWTALAEHVLVAVNLDRPESRMAVQRWAGREKVRVPGDGATSLVVLDPAGHVVAQAPAEELSKDGTLNSSHLIEFARRHAPAKPDARKLLDDALAQAKHEGKHVLVDESAPYCGPCVRLAKYLEANRALIDKDYVWVTLDRRFANGKEVMAGLRPNDASTPWMVILAPDAKPVITSDAAEGNIGFPSDADGQAHWEKMLRAGAKRLTDAEIRELIARLKTP